MTDFRLEGPGSGGDVDGPASATDNAIARFDGTGGKTLQDSKVTIGDTGLITQTATADIDNIFYNTVDSNASDAREIRLTFRGDTAAGAAHDMVEIMVSHNGAAADHQGRFRILLNDGNDSSVPTSEILNFTPREAVFNELGQNNDFRVEGDTDPNLFIIDASDDAVRIGEDTSSKIGFYGLTAVVQPSALTGRDSTVVVDDATALLVINNTRTRLNDLEDRLQALGLLA